MASRCNRVNLSVSTPIWDLCSRLLGIDPRRLLLDKSLQNTRKQT